MYMTYTVLAWLQRMMPGSLNYRLSLPLSYSFHGGLNTSGRRGYSQTTHALSLVLKAIMTCLSTGKVAV